MRVRSLAFMVVVSACGGDDGGAPDAATGPKDWPLMEPPLVTVPEVGVRRELVRVPGFDAPANPVTGEDGPASYDATQVLRYRTDVDPPAPARAIIVAFPGFLGGGASWDSLARTLVRRGAASGEIVEVWAIDRRANQLEDLRGTSTAEMLGDPEIAWRYYYAQDTIDGARFPGFLFPGEVSYLSEWGLATHAEDLRRVIALVPAADRQARVFLAGHSLGASFAEAYAAWRFSDGLRGVEELAGIVLIDGVLGAPGDPPPSEMEYTQGGGGGLTSIAGLDDIRAGGAAYFELPLLGVSVYAAVEILSQRALSTPGAIVDDDERDAALRVLWSYGGGPFPHMTDAAALGLGFDDATNGLSFAAVSCGHSQGGALEQYDNEIFGGTLSRPADANATYSWVDALDADPAEHTPLANLAHSFVDGRTNFAEWYFPSRLSLDLGAVAGARVAEDGWQASYGLAAFDGALIDAPFLCVSAGAGLVAASEFEPLRARLAPIGAGRPFAGATRAEDDAFRVVVAAGQTHIDPLTAEDTAQNQVPEEIEAFVLAHVPAGTVTVPAQP